MKFVCILQENRKPALEQLLLIYESKQHNEYPFIYGLFAEMIQEEFQRKHTIGANVKTPPYVGAQRLKALMHNCIKVLKKVKIFVRKSVKTVYFYGNGCL
ncbi:hypothetical protein [Alkalicoccus halolimnae]|uniref:Uncharacterized protein n=1 Tax=Alkalicoccus halolimnae TaxID=1667239 RepID=A0A5C7F2X7_9BACI|nr:hypothetical protein [Alkalicoccus halolimnae]TXF81544.1 hypothetical protein FTX54_15830 [Alkalicoccus halolimnae]